MKKCSDKCSVACDFCRMFNFNSLNIGKAGNIYVGQGYCVLHEQNADPGEFCEDFICVGYKTEKAGLPHWGSL